MNELSDNIYLDIYGDGNEINSFKECQQIQIQFLKVTQII